MPLARERHQPLEGALGAPQAREAVRQDPAGQEVVELLLHEGRQRHAVRLPTLFRPVATQAWVRVRERAPPGPSGWTTCGRSWIISPEGELLAETTASRPFETVEIDLRHADSAKATYPRNLTL